MRMISANQIRAVHAALSGIGMDDETYRDLLSREFDGAASCKDLDLAQANELLNMLNGRQKKPAAKRRQAQRRQPIQNPAPPRNDAADATVVHLMTPTQDAYIRDLRAKITWYAADGYQAWLKKALGLDRVRTSTEASDVIRGLKKMLTYYQAEPEKKV